MYGSVHVRLPLFEKQVFLSDGNHQINHTSQNHDYHHDRSYQYIKHFTQESRQANVRLHLYELQFFGADGEETGGACCFFINVQCSRLAYDCSVLIVDKDSVSSLHFRLLQF